MKNYEKPIVLLNSDLSEGVYAASGDFQTNGVIESSQLDNPGNTSFKDYKVSLKNTTNGNVTVVSAFINETGSGVTRVISLSNFLYCERTSDGRVFLRLDNGSQIAPFDSSQVAYIRVEGNEPYGLEEIRIF